MTLFNTLIVDITTNEEQREQAVHAIHEHKIGIFHVKDQSVIRPVADILITDTKHIPLTHGFADCVPLIFYDPARQALVFAHAGWKGLTAGAIETSINWLRYSFQSAPANLYVWVGPCIHKDSYVFIDPPVQLHDLSWKDHVEKTRDGFHIDLPGFVHAECIRLGILKEHIVIDKRDTYTDPQLPSHVAYTRGNRKKRGNFLITVTLQ